MSMYRRNYQSIIWMLTVTVFVATIIFLSNHQVGYAGTLFGEDMTRAMPYNEILQKSYEQARSFHTPPPPPHSFHTPEMEVNTLLTFITELNGALNSTADHNDILPLASDQFLLAEWWDEWGTMADMQLATELDSLSLTGPVSTELLSNNAHWFLGHLNPYEELLPSDVDVEAVLITHGWNSDGDTQALLFITAAEDGGYEWGGMLYTNTGFMRH